MGTRRADDSASYGVGVFGAVMVVLGAFLISPGLGLITVGAFALYGAKEMAE